MVLLHHRSTHRSLLLQLFNINSLQISLSRWFIFTNNTQGCIPTEPPPPLFSCPHPFTVRLTRQLHFRRAGETSTITQSAHRWSGGACLSYKQASIKKIYTHVSVYRYMRHSFPKTWTRVVLHVWGDRCAGKQGGNKTAYAWILDPDVFILMGYIPICHRAPGFWIISRWQTSFVLHWFFNGRYVWTRFQPGRLKLIS